MEAIDFWKFASLAMSVLYIVLLMADASSKKVKTVGMLTAMAWLVELSLFVGYSGTTVFDRFKPKIAPVL